jgi:hypothetical protein
VTPQDRPTACPQCALPLTGDPVCAQCGLRLTGPEAVRLWEIDTELVRLEARSSALGVERNDLLARLRTAPAPTPVPAAATAPPAAIGPVPWPGAGAGNPWAPAASGPDRRETSPRSAQNVLLTLGALLLAVAVTIFAAVTYDALGDVGRALVLATLTAVAGTAVPVLSRRGLPTSADAVTAVFLVLGALTAGTARAAGLGTGLDLFAYAAVATALLALAAAGLATVAPARLARYAALGLAQLPAPMLLVAGRAGLGTAAVVLVGQAAVDLELAERWPAGWDRHVRTMAWACGGVTAAAVLLSCSSGFTEQSLRGALALAGLAALAAVVGLRHRDDRLGLVSAGVAPLLALAALVVAAPRLDDTLLPLVAVGVALAGAAVLARMPVAYRQVPALGVLAVAAGAVVSQLEPVMTALFGPAAWLFVPWTRLGGGARASLRPFQIWSGSAVTPTVLVLAAVVVWATAARLGRRSAALILAGALTLVAAATLPVALDLPYVVALGVLLALAAGLVAVALRVPAPVGRLLSVVAVGPALLAAVWSVADRDATAPVLAVVTVLAIALAVGGPDRGPAAALAGCLVGLTTATAGLAADLSAPRAGALLPPVTAGLLVLAAVPALGRAREAGLELAALVVGFGGLVLAADDPGWLAWSLAADAALLLATGLRREREVSLATGAGAGVAAVGAALSADLPVAMTSLLLLGTTVVLLGLTAIPVLQGARRTGVELGALAVGAGAVVLAAGDPAWLSWTLAADGVLVLATALRPDRRAVAAGAGTLLLAASSWVRLVDADVRAPEPYVLPLAVVALTVGVLRRRSQPELPSTAAYGPGLSLGLVPSLLAVAQGGLLRPLLLAAAALAVLLWGVRSRLRAPLSLGGGVLALDALYLLLPYAAALPRWAPLAGAGLLLVVLGATYERRLADLNRLRGAYASLA